MGISVSENIISTKDNTVRKADASAKIKKPRRLRKGKVDDTFEDDTGNMVHLPRDEIESSVKNTTVIEAVETPAKLEMPCGLEEGEDKDMLQDDMVIMEEISRDQNQSPMKDRAAREVDEMLAKVKSNAN